MKKSALLVSGILAAALAALAVYVDGDDAKPSPSSHAAASPPAAQAPSSTAEATAAPGTSPSTASNSIADPPLTLAGLEQRLAEAEPRTHDQVLESALPAMVANNPNEVARFAELQTDPRLRESLVRQVAQLWSNADTDSALAWVRTLPDSPERAATLIDLSLSVALTDPRRAIGMRESDVGNIEPDGVLDSLVQQWAEKDFDAALAWTNARPRTGQRDKLLQRIVYVQAASGAPEAAARFVDDAFEDGPMKQEALAIVKSAARTP